MFKKKIPFYLPPGCTIRMVGISGAGMSALAHLCLDQGYQIEGQDQQINHWTQALIDRGMKFKLEAIAWPIDDAKVLVYSSAIGKDHPLRQSNIPQLKRGDFLGYLVKNRSVIAIGGTHGKTTITSMCAYVLKAVGHKVGYLVGGQSDQLPLMGMWGDADQPFIAEADESDSSILAFEPNCLLISSIEPDHLENHGNNFQQLIDVFRQAIKQVSSQGIIIACLDCPNASKLIKQTGRPVITYGFDQSSDIQIVSEENSDAADERTFIIDGKRLSIQLHQPSSHLVQNIAGVLAICHHYQLPIDQVAKAISAFKGVKRRMERLPVLKLAMFQIPVIEDYGHHPTSIQSIIVTLRANQPDKKLVMVFQPHRYSRTEALFEGFVSALSQVDQLILLPIYSHGERQRPVSSQALADAILAGHPGCKVDFITNDQLASTLSQELTSDSLLIIQGAGTVGKLFDSARQNLESSP
jgi:UDP-N-acetylmuramate--alanine ligase